MRSTAVCAGVILLLTLIHPPGAAESVSIVICYPGAPGTTEQAEKVMAAFSRTLEQVSGLPGGKVRCVFYPEAKPALEFIEKERPVLGIFSLPFYLRYKSDLALVPVLQVVRQEKATQTFHVIAKKGRYGDLDSLKGKRLVSNHLFDPAFLDRVVLEGRKVGPFQTEQTRKPLRAIRKAARGEEDAVLVDSKQWTKLQDVASLKGQLEEVHRSRPLPTEPVVAIGDAGAHGDRAKIEAGLRKMHEAEAGRQVFAEFQMDRFQEPDEKAYADAVALYGGGEK